MVIPGDYSTAMQDHIKAGRITGYGGTGTAIYDYNISNPGKTTVKAIEGELGGTWHVASTLYSTNELIITPFDAAADFGIVADGVTDVTDETPGRPDPARQPGRRGPVPARGSLQGQRQPDHPVRGDAARRLAEAGRRPTGGRNGAEGLRRPGQ